MTDSISTEGDAQGFGSIRYKLIRNGAASKKAGHTVYSAMVLNRETYGTVEIAERMVRENCPLNASTIRMVISDLANLVAQLVSEGRMVNLGGVVRFMPVICGTFDSVDEPWNPQKHKVKIKACSGSNMREAARESPVERTEVPVAPLLLQLFNPANNRSDTISSGREFLVSGEHLSWNPEAPDEGWFINYDGREYACAARAAEGEDQVVWVRADVAFREAGESLLLIFRTRLGGKSLHQTAYGRGVVSA